ncbi:MAG: hypothetical protein K2I70_04200, partial [Bacilli bacterium]|nr:hypothetical protein [Bacilli bacterium]
QFNELILPNNASDDTFYHELSHMFDLFCREYEDKIFARWFDVGRCTLVEAMTNDLAGVITDVESYEKYEAILDYFRNYVEISYDDFNQKGINYFADLLCKKYPKVDIEFILCALDTINDTEKAKNQFFFLDSVDDLTDEIFKICTTELNNASENYYAPFWEFARVLYYTSDIKNPASDNQPEIMYEYLDRYNDLLKDMGYKGEFITKEKILEKVGKYKDIEYIFYKENSAIPVVGTFSKEEENGRLGFYLQTFDEDGNKIEMLQGDYSHPITYITNLYYFMQITGVEYFDIIGTDEYWKMVGIDSGCMKVKDIESVPIYLDGELLGNEFIDSLTINIGLSSDGALAYEIKKEDGYLLYSSDDLANNTSNPVPLNKFLSNYNPKDF